MLWIEKARKIFMFISVEPVMLCWAFPAFMLFSSYENIPIEIVCRQSIKDSGFHNDLCTVLVRKNEFNIDCDSKNTTTTSEIAEIFPSLRNTLESNLTEFVDQICTSEIEVQKKLAVIYSLRTNLAAIVPLIIVLFAGSWSDKKGVKKPLMFFPIVGELVACIVCLLSAIFMDSIPAELPAFGVRVFPSLFGAEQLMTLGLYSYMTAISSEEDRTLRFGIFSVIFSLVPIFAAPLSHLLYIKMGYIKLCLLCIVIFCIGLIYTTFVLKETNAKAPEIGSTTELPMESRNGSVDTIDAAKPKNFCTEFFDIKLVKETISVLFKKRENFMRTVFILVLLTYILNYCVPNGEGTILFLFLRIRFGWDTQNYTSYFSFIGFLGLAGTLFMVGVLSKVLKLQDVVLGLISITLAVFSRIIQAFASTGEMFYAGAFVDFTGPSKFTVFRSIVSKIVSPTEIGSAFSILTISEPLVQLVAPLIYGFVYNLTFEEQPNTIFWLGSAFHAVSLIVFIFVYRILSKFAPQSEPNPEESKKDIELKDDTAQSTKL